MVAVTEFMCAFSSHNRLWAEDIKSSCNRRPLSKCQTGNVCVCVCVCVALMLLTPLLVFRLLLLTLDKWAGKWQRKFHTTNKTQKKKKIILRQSLCQFVRNSTFEIFFLTTEIKRRREKKRKLNRKLNNENWLR